jgi:hypothetical protein
MSKTLREKFIEALIARGERKTHELTSSIVFTRKEGGYYYVGRSGSLRYGSSRTNSVPCSSKWKAMLLIEGMI